MKTIPLVIASAASALCLSASVATSGASQPVATKEGCPAILALADKPADDLLKTGANARQANRNRFRYNFNEAASSNTAPAKLAAAAAPSGCEINGSKQAVNLD